MMLGRTRHKLTVDGELVDMVPMGGRHADCVEMLSEALILALHGSHRVRVRLPIELGDHTEVYPDLTVLRESAGGRTGANPTEVDALLVIEVADATAHDDRQTKIPRYDRHGVPEVWLVDLPGHAVTVYSDPAPAGYRVEMLLRRGKSIDSHVLPQLHLAIDDILGPAQG